MKDQAVRFLLVGLTSTGIHFLILSVLFKWLGVNIVLASSIAFLGSFAFAYLANYHFTFVSTTEHLQGVSKFLLANGIGFLWNVSLMYLFVEVAHWHYALAFLVMSSVVATNNFLLGKFWVFAMQGERGQIYFRPRFFWKI